MKVQKEKENQCHRPQHERRQCHNAIECKKEKEINTRHQKRKVSRKRYNTIARKGNLNDLTPFTFKCNKINVHTKQFVYVVTNPLFGRWLVAIPQSSNPGIGSHPLHPPHFTRVHGMDFTNIFKNQVLVFISHSFQPICFTSVKLKLNCLKIMKRGAKYKNGPLTFLHRKYGMTIHPFVKTWRSLSFCL